MRDALLSSLYDLPTKKFNIKKWSMDPHRRERFGPKFLIFLLLWHDFYAPTTFMCQRLWKMFSFEAFPFLVIKHFSIRSFRPKGDFLNHKSYLFLKFEFVINHPNKLIEKQMKLSFPFLIALAGKHHTHLPHKWEKIFVKFM